MGDVSLPPANRPLIHTPPVYHLKAPRGWINDPCAPGYDPVTGTYHLFYQWNPDSCDWGNISWGHFISRDGVFWEQNGAGPVLKPDAAYDNEGIFTGCFYPTGMRGEKGHLTAIYSSVTIAPIHWSIPYSQNAGLSVAVSTDGGRNWQKSNLNPILRGEPEDLTVTGFRDPYLAEWPALDEIRGEKSLYGLVSGGILDQGPTVFLYAVAPDDLATWNYLGQLADLPAGFRSPGRWSPDFGINWECANFVTLQDGSDEGHFLILGSEGGRNWDSDHHKTNSQGAQVAVWMAGSLNKTPKGPKFEHESSGVFDYGDLYAPNSYEHPDTKKRILWGWIKEDDLTLARREAKGWTGHLSLPRELFLYTVKGVTGTLKTPLEDICSIQVSDCISTGNAAKNIQTLGIRPLSDLQTLKQSRPTTWSNLGAEGGTGRLMDNASSSWELEATINVQRDQGRLGFYIRHDNDLSQRTSISFSAQEEKIVVDRCLSNNQEDVKKHNISGPFTLFSFSEEGAEVMEKLHLRIFCDGDVLEVFANDRFALSTMVYSESPLCTGISWFADQQDSTSHVFESIKLWESLAKVSI
ncbi:glycosyl hydrolase [Dactylonectria macrodidyma]|uniref:Glycosyl hydrolase n=1 Tax=Dactylonectria macrodidyma TaxID=307937 RepID=A0A9P9FMB4_9HYPO|nr:glycosyl hydrolase [Dactylonectria macrodidyma]